MRSAFARQEAPPRPSLPPVLLVALAFWLGCVATGHAGAGNGDEWGILAVCGVLGTALAALALRRRGPAILVACLAFALLGCALSQVSALALEHQRATAVEAQGKVFVFRAIEDPSESSYGKSILCEAWQLEEAGNLLARLRPLKVRLYFSGDEYSFGSEFKAKASFSQPSEQALAYFDRKGIALGCKVSKMEELASSGVGTLASLRSGFASRVDALAENEGWESDASSLLKALVIGDRSTLFDSFLYQEVKVAGLAHLVAVSGSHLVIVLGFIRALLGALCAPRRLAIGAQIVFLLLYLIMVGFPISCLRAACMSAAGLLSFSNHRRSHALSSLGVVIIVFIALDPSCANSLSFALSALSTLGIVLFTGLFASWLPLRSKRLRELFASPLCMTLAALLATFPLSVATFAQLPIVSPASNIVAAPFVSWICGLGLLGFTCMPLPMASDALLTGAYGLCLAFTVLLDGLMSIPFICIPAYGNALVLGGAALAMAAAAWIAWPRRFPKRIALGLCVCTLAACLATGVAGYFKNEIVMLDVGQGDAFVVRSQGKAILIDTGNQPSLLYAALARQGLFRLDAAIVTHADDDHCGCLEGLAGVVPVKQVVFAQGMVEAASSTQKIAEVLEDAERLAGEGGVVEVPCNAGFSVGRFELTVIAPDGLVDEGGNADSLCLLMRSDIDGNGTSEWSALFCGDAEADELNELVASGKLGEVDVYKVGHHGALAALDEKLAAALHPHIALISVGENNTYGHPRQEVIDLLQEQGAQVFRTDEQGDVVCSLTAQSITVSTLR